ncbi:hypothetical protein HID58_040455 [Brassica napus]|uniref:Protein kinase domain-containing protein n=1 Tax=Brassica napus TaxID=3708 RepID=A0ABQ8B8Y2_BRANA|nr:hypothetical protein HID58_040455 [Brassica napus]
MHSFTYFEANCDLIGDLHDVVGHLRLADGHPLHPRPVLCINSSKVHCLIFFTKKSVTPCVVLIEFFRSVKVVLVVFIKPSLTIQLQLAKILILFHLLSLLRDSNDKVNRYVCNWLCLGYCSEDTKSFLLWKQRLEIMLRAAQGLVYFHELQVIYRAFKS